MGISRVCIRSAVFRYKDIIIKKLKNYYSKLCRISIVLTAILPSLVFAQHEVLSRRISILKKYDSQHLLKIAMPMGGIGTGTVSLGGRGQLKDWEIMNVPGKGFSTVETGNNAPFFAIYTKSATSTSKTKALLGPVDDSEYEDAFGHSVNHHGLPRFRTASFESAYPFGIVSLSDSTFPVAVKLVGYNPFIPGDSDASGIPVAVLQYEVTSRSAEAVDVAVCGSMRNFIGKDGMEFRMDWKNDVLPLGENNNVNTHRQSKELDGIFMHSAGVDSLHPAWGTIALVTPEREGVSWRTSSSEMDRWENAILDFWDDFSSDGVLMEKDEQKDHDPMASLAVKKSLNPGETKVFTFYITWHFPNRQSWDKAPLPKTRVGNYYTTIYEDAWDVIEKEFPRLPLLTEKTLLFVNSVVESSFADVVKEAALFNTSTLRSQTVFRTEDGNMYGWEGVFDGSGSCYGSCTHVWNYEQATAFLFNDLARTMREIEFGYSIKDNGHMIFRTNLPLNAYTRYGIAAADGQMGTIMKFYREWQLSGNNSFLKKHWKKVKAALAFAWVTNGWDGDQDGVMEGVQHNTMDIEYFGPNPQMQIWYLGALKSAGIMAAAMQDYSFADTCNKLFRHGSRWTDENLFNGEYYIQKIQTPVSKDSIAKGLVAGMGSLDFNDIKYQLATGCLVDQLVGQYMAHTLGLGYLVDREHVKTTLRSIYRYNRRDSFLNHFNNMRSYAMGDEKALLMASYPKGERPGVPFPYWSEVMTGFEYTAAVGMLYEGLTDQGLDVITNIRDRYNGRRRNPFDEIECGHHYARAMASWAGIIAESGFNFSGIDHSIRFTDKPGRYFWSNGSAWGVCAITKSEQKYSVRFYVYHGSIKIKQFFLGDSKTKKFDGIENVQENNVLKFSVRSDS